MKKRCPNCNANYGERMHICPNCGWVEKRRIEHTLTLSQHEAATGCEKILHLDAFTQALRIKIQPGIRDGAEIHITNPPALRFPSDQPYELYIIIKIAHVASQPAKQKRHKWPWAIVAALFVFLVIDIVNHPHNPDDSPLSDDSMSTWYTESTTMQEETAPTSHENTPLLVSPPVLTGDFSQDLSQVVAAYTKDTPPEEANPYYSGRLIVKTNTDSPDFSHYSPDVVLYGPDDTYILQFSTEQAAKQAAADIATSSDIIYAEPDAYAHICQYEGISWGVKSTNANLLAEYVTKEGGSAVVAVVDTGVSSEPLLADRLLPGWNFYDGNSNTSDAGYHGTHVAGIVADCTYGTAIRILPVRVMNAEGGPWSIVAQGVRYAAEQGADIINLSLGGPHSNYIDDAIHYAQSLGSIVVVAAGNDSHTTSEKCPAHIDSCITVSAVEQKGDTYKVAEFSNIGSAVDFAAPGVAIKSTVPGGFGNLNGTSMATPHISALAAMLRAADIAHSATAIESVLAGCSQDLGEPGKDIIYGYGIPQMEEMEVLQAPTMPLYNHMIQSNFTDGAAQYTPSISFSADGRFLFSQNNANRMYDVTGNYYVCFTDNAEPMIVCTLDEEWATFFELSQFYLKGGAAGWFGFSARLPMGMTSSSSSFVASSDATLINAPLRENSPWSTYGDAPFGTWSSTSNSDATLYVSQTSNYTLHLAIEFYRIASFDLDVDICADDVILFGNEEISGKLFYMDGNMYVEITSCSNSYVQPQLLTFDLRS